eukprot:TRINITY_DN13516_c0_g1_i1.p1 TRINITY_DN13516_c0_g1~~TRINITY_DN13516_c0_g1_i1.p1  ORF type:complete len:214 (+),score=37.54 TRINITY_DN13516_c0_g1_i1:142-783(+)
MLADAKDAAAYKQTHSSATIIDFFRNGKRVPCPCAEPHYINEVFLNAPKVMPIEIGWHSGFSASDLRTLLHMITPSFTIKFANNSTSTLYYIQSLVCFDPKQGHNISFTKKGKDWIMHNDMQEPRFLHSLEEVFNCSSILGYFPNLVIYAIDKEVIEEADPNLDPKNSMNFAYMTPNPAPIDEAIDKLRKKYTPKRNLRVANMKARKISKRRS